MGFFSDFMGTSQQKDLKASKAASDAALSQGYSTAQGNYSTAQGMYDPYVQSGRKASGMYENALGLNGVDAQKSFGANYAASDPFREQNADFANNALMRQFNARVAQQPEFHGPPLRWPPAGPGPAPDRSRSRSPAAWPPGHRR